MDLFDDGIRVCGSPVTIDDGIRVYSGTSFNDRVSDMPLANPDGATRKQDDDGIRIFTTKKFQKFLVDSTQLNKPSDQVYDQSSALIIGNKLRRNFKPRDKSKVLAYRKNIDMYTGQACDHTKTLSVDHIFEVQCMTHVIAKVSNGRPSPIFETLIPELKKILNLYENLNVTTLSLNCSKMNAFKWFLCDSMYMAYPLDTFLNETKCSDYIPNIKFALSSAYKAIRMSIISLKSKHDFSMHHNIIDSVVRELDVMMLKFKLD